MRKEHILIGRQRVGARLQTLWNVRQRRRRAELALLLAFVLTAAIGFADFYRGCAAVREDVLRLHVIANSDSAADQRVKLAVRDAVLRAGAEIFDGSVTAAQAEEKILPQQERLLAAAQQVLRDNGMDETVTLSVTKEFFNTRVYDGFTMPAGQYRAVKIVIGSGAGRNWWCVMFPPLCLGAAAQDDQAQEAAADACFTGQETRVVASSPRFEPRFKIVEWIERWKQRR